MHYLIAAVAIVALVLFIFLPWQTAMAWYVAVLACLAAAFWLVSRLQGKPTDGGTRVMIGERAVVIEVREREITVRWSGEVWQAASDEPVHPGQEVVIVGREGLLLKIKKP